MKLFNMQFSPTSFHFISLDPASSSETPSVYKILLLYNGTGVKIEFILEFYKLIHNPFNILRPHLYITAYKFSILQASITGHQMTPCSAGPPFEIWEKGNYHVWLNPVGGGGGQAL
jgi:hypothetical protein